MVTASGASLPRHETQPGRGLIVGFRRTDQVDPILPAAGLELTDEDLIEIEGSAQ